MRRNKYGAIKTTVDGIVFASKREAHRYRELKLLERAGHISGLELQPRFPLMATGQTRLVGHYVADFAYIAQGERVIEDAKGMKTPLYKWKKKHTEQQYGITITEV